MQVKGREIQVDNMQKSVTVAQRSLCAFEMEQVASSSQVVLDTYPMFTKLTIIQVSSGFSGTYGLIQKLC